MGCKTYHCQFSNSGGRKTEKYCRQTGRPATDVIRELIRALPVNDDSKDVTNN